MKKMSNRTSSFMQPQSEEQLQERKKNFLRKHSRSPTKKELAEGMTCTACHRPSRKNIDTPEYWRRVRSLSRENRIRLDSRENQQRLAEHDEAKRRKEILTRRKNEREDLANRYLRNPLKAFRHCSVDTDDMKGDRLVISRSVPDLEEAFKAIREGQLAKARSQTLTNSTYESWAKQKDKDTPLICHKYPYESLTNQNLKECSTSPRKNKKENQKAYPTRSKEELMARHSRYHQDDQIPFSRSSRLRIKKNQKEIIDKNLESFESSSLPGGNIIMVQKPKFIRRRSMPDLSKCKCIRSTIVFESVASLDNPQNSEEVIILQRPPSRYRSSDNKLKHSSSISKKNINYRNSSKNKSFASHSNSVDEIYSKASKQLITCTEKYMKTSSYFQISRRKEWTADQVSKSELKRLVIPQKDLTPNISTTQTDSLLKETNSVFLNKNRLTNSEGNELNFYDSLEEVNGSGPQRNKPFFVSLDDDNERGPQIKKPFFVSLGEESESSSINEIMLSPQHSSRMSSHHRPRTAFSKIKDLCNFEPKVYPSEIEALLLSGSHLHEHEHISEFATKSLDLNKNGKLHLSSASIDLLTSKLPELSNSKSECRKLSTRKITANHNYNHDDTKVSGNDCGKSIDGYIDIISDKVFLIRNESRIINVNNNNKAFET